MLPLHLEYINSTQSVGNYLFSSFTFQNKFYIIFWTSRKLFTKKKQLYELKKILNE